ncbi:CPBP family intramembrane glutamic endopeptidase [Hyalangium versicolor]|uniref:CPBP family intramembrane glutamic endopeptidase n=1 Tax=Hyalangium versicolor TaxID=2861190 RepID=UPI001CCEDE39|nr:CPBP family intramembrane glutamic endopeptidase [Hyalangium versicolor]
MRRPSESLGRRFLRFPLTRIVLGTFAVALSVGLAMSLASSMGDKLGGSMWKWLMGASAALAAYGLYVRLTERRPLSEFSQEGAPAELGLGLLTGALLVVAVIGMLATVGAYAWVGSNGWSMTFLIPLAEMIFAGVFEELLFRGILFRITEQSLGSWPALAISAFLFGLAHLAGAGAGVLAIANTVVAGAFFAAAFMVTRRLWLCIGMHVAWNYTLGTLFSIAVSGHESTGLLQGRLSGPDWLTGGQYGVEGSVFTLLVLSVASAWLLWRAKAKGHVVARAPRTAGQPTG